MECSFSAGDFKYTRASREKPAEKEKESEEAAAERGAFPSPKDGCTRVFQRISSHERHLSFEKCTTSLERLSLLDLAKTEYDCLLREGMASMLTLLLSTSTLVTISSTAQEGWALKESKKPYRFNEKQKSYLEAKFNLGQETGRKLHPKDIAKEMRRVLNSDGKRLFKPMEFLTERQITSFFGRLAAKVRQQLVATDEDIYVAEEEVNFHKAGEEILADINLEHPLVFDQYNICALVRDNSLTKFKLGLLQMLCQKFNLEAVEGLNVITFGLKCNKVLNVITFGPKCNKVLNVITFSPKCNKPPMKSFDSCSALLLWRTSTMIC